MRNFGRFLQFSHGFLWYWIRNIRRKLRSLRLFNFNTLVHLLRLDCCLLLWLWFSKMIDLWFYRFVYRRFWFLSRKRLLIRFCLMMKILIFLLWTFCNKTLFYLNFFFSFFSWFFFFFCLLILIRILEWVVKRLFFQRTDNFSFNLDQLWRFLRVDLNLVLWFL